MAPYFLEITAGPATEPFPAQAVWRTAADGVRLRIASWGADATGGTVLLFPGRTEFVEKYAPVAAEFYARGFASVAIDWRGQGLADRLAPHRALGHVGRFLDYQKDVAELVAHVRESGLPQPCFLLGHSMGGAIGLRALLDGLPVKSAVFTGPMWGIRIAPHMRPIAWGLSSASRPFGLAARFAPGQKVETYVSTAPFEGNSLTSDPEMFAFMRNQLEVHPELSLGGASLGWINESLREMRRLVAAKAVDIPVLTFIGSEETIVDRRPVRRRMATWPKGELVELPATRHEVLMEAPATRKIVFDRAAALFDATR